MLNSLKYNVFCIGVFLGIVIHIGVANGTIRTVIKDDWVVNDDISGMCAKLHPSVAVSRDGNFVVAWNDGRNGDWDVFVCVFDNFGVPQTENIRVNDKSVGENLNGPTVSVAVDDSGNFVVAWHRKRVSEDIPPMQRYDIYARRYNHLGEPQGTAFRVNHLSADFKYAIWPSVAMDKEGNFVIVWDWQGFDPNHIGVYGQLYDKFGTPQGENFQIDFSSDPLIDNFYPDVAMNNNGNFTVVWKPTVYAFGIWAQRFDSTGVPIGENFRVDDGDAPGSGYDILPPSIATSDSGRFVVTWQQYGGAIYCRDVYAKLYDNTGVPQGSDFKVNDIVCYGFEWVLPCAAMDSDGDFVIVWEQDHFPTPMGQLYDKYGTPQGSNFDIPKVGNIDFGNAVLMDGDGNFVVALSPGTFSYKDLYAQQFDYFANPQGNPVNVNGDINSSYQIYPSVAVDATGNFAVVWQDQRSVTNPHNEPADIYAQLYDNLGVPVGTNFKVNDKDILHNPSTCVAKNSTGNFVVVWDGYSVYDNPDTMPPGGYEIYAKLYDSSGNPQTNQFVVNENMAGIQENPAIAMEPTGNFVVVWVSYSSNLDIYAKRFDPSGNPQGASFKVNDYKQITRLGMNPSVAMDNSGNFIITWEGKLSPALPWRVYSKCYDYLGNALGDNFIVNEDTLQYERHSINASVAMDKQGSFVVSWQSDRNGNWDIWAQKYKSGGIPDGVNFKVNDDAGTSNQVLPCVTMHPNGDKFVIFWTDYRNGDEKPEVFAQLYDLSDAIGTNVQINNPDSLSYFRQETTAHSVAASFDRIVFTWQDTRRQKGWDIYAKLTDWDISGIEENSELEVRTAGFRVSPNPASQNFRVRLNLTGSEKEVSLKLYDLSGRLVKQMKKETLIGGTYFAPFTTVELPCDIYFIEVKTLTATYREKVVILK